MNTAVVLLCLLSFALLGALPFFFFKSGRVTLGWWLTAAPFFTDSALLLAGSTGLLTPIDMPGAVRVALQHLAVPFVAAAMALIGCTVGAHSNPVSMWHQEDDRPASLVTFGPYSRIRHPFYASFILMLIGATLAMPHPGTLLMLAAGCAQLHRTARREEKRLTEAFGGEYATYMKRTGRFMPRLPGRATSMEIA
jgi:protein-S-isoprenylcysteine O-methyltransferase Ste14